MTTSRGWWALAGVVAISAVLLLVVYSAAYFLMVSPGPIAPRTGPVVEGSRDERPAIYPARLQSVWNWFFSPIHQVDLRLRPHTWYAVQPPRSIPGLPPPHP
jgi:hypothetical protein